VFAPLTSDNHNILILGSHNHEVIESNQKIFLNFKPIKMTKDIHPIVDEE